MAFLTPTVLGIASLVVGVGGAIYQGVTASQTAKYNAQVADQQATYAKQKAALEAEQHEAKMRRLLGEQKVGFAKAGVSPLGSPQDIFSDTLELGMVDAALIRAGGDAEASAYSAKAGQYEREGKSALIGGVMKAGGALITNFDTYGSSYEGLFGGGSSAPKMATSAYVPR